MHDLLTPNTDEMLIRVQKSNTRDWICPNCDTQHELVPDEQCIRCYECRANFDTRHHGTIIKPKIPLVSMEVGTGL